MRIVEKLLYGICGITGLMLLFILLCHLNPNLAKGFAGNVEAKTYDKPIQETPVNTVNNISNEIQNIEIGNKVLNTPEYEVISGTSTLEIPNAMLALSGLEVPEGKMTEVSEKRAEELQQDLTTGNLGEDLSYDKKYYPYYYMLEDKEQKLYRQIHANANDLLTRFAPVENSIDKNSLNRAFTAVVNDHPELFWINTGYGFYVAPDKSIIEIDLSYNFTAKDLETHKNKFDKACEEIIYGSRGQSGDYEKEVYVHNALAKTTVYDMKAPANQSAYSALVTGRTVCAGYARAFQLIMQKLGVPTYYCTGIAGENHAWNITKLEGDYYNVDVTWDDQTPLIYDYFNKSDADYRKDHIRRDLAIKLPACLGEKYSNLEKNETVEEVIKEEKPVVTEKTDEKTAIEEALNKILTENVKQEEIKVTVTPPRELNYHIYDDEGEYYVECAHRMMEDKDNNISFDLYLDSEELWDEVKEGYLDGTYERAYIDRVLAERHLNGAKVSVTGQPMSDGTVRVRHSYTLY